jgi:hypothetical protein
MRGGKDYDSDFAKRMKGEGLWADMLKQRFKNAARRLGMNRRQYGILDMSEFQPIERTAVQSPKAQSQSPQLKLF